MVVLQQVVPSWLVELSRLVEADLTERERHRGEQRPALERELRELNASIDEIRALLLHTSAKPNARDELTTMLENALGRRREVESEISEFSAVQKRNRKAVEPAAVLKRVKQFAKLICGENATRANLELGMIVERVVVHRDETVVVRTCKLGVMPDVLPLLSAGDGDPPAPEMKRAGKSQRRSKLRIVDDEGEDDLRAKASFVADPERFAGLDEKWFWIDQLCVPKSTSWSDDHAEAVFRRRQEGVSFPVLADEFGVSEPTVRKAVQIYLQRHPLECDAVKRQRGGTRRPKFDLSVFADEARELWLDGVSKPQLANRYHCSEPTVTKAIAFAYTRDGRAMPTAKELRLQKAQAVCKALRSGTLLTTVAKQYKISTATAREYLRQSLAIEGQLPPDLRKLRKGNRKRSTPK